MTRHSRSMLQLLFLMVALSTLSWTQAEQSERPAVPKKTPDVIFVPTPQPVVDRMLELAEVDGKDVVYDLGCGDGRIVITAAKKYGARGVGIDIDPQRIMESRTNAKAAGVTDKVKFLETDLFTTDISEATAVTLYLLSSLNQRLMPKLLKELKPGTPIVSHDFDMGDWKPEVSEEVKGPTRTHRVYKWRVPAKASGAWRWKNGADSYRLSVLQAAFNITATLTRNGIAVPVQLAELNGKDLRVVAEGREFSGAIEGDGVYGFTAQAGSSQTWSAQRQETLAAGN